MRDLQINRPPDDLLIQGGQAGKRCVAPDVGQHLSGQQVSKAGFADAAAFEPGLEWVKSDVWL